MSGQAPLFTLKEGVSLILASASPRRRQFLQEWGLPFATVRPTGAEPAPKPGEEPAAYACRAACAKAWAARALLQNVPAEEGVLARPVILAADTVVAIDGIILGKPRNARHALAMLTRLSGRGHRVISAVCLLLPPEAHGKGQLPPGAGFAPHVFSDMSEVFFHPWPREILSAYARSKEPQGKAGGYAIQGRGAFLVERVAGSWATVVGLPVGKLAQTLLEWGLMRVNS